MNGKRLAKVLIYPLEAGRLSFLMVFAILSSTYLLPYVFYPVAYGQELDNQCPPGQGIEPDSGQCVELPGAATPQQPTQSQERHQQLLEQYQLQQQQVQQPTQTPPQQPTLQPLSVEIIPNGAEGVAPATFEFGVTIGGGTEPYTFNWDFGDGSAGSDQPPIQHTFEEAGTYDVWVVVTDTNNVEASNTVQVVVTPQSTPQSTPERLSVEINPSDTKGVAPATFEFGTSIIGGTGPYTYSWDFGDGATASDQANTQHTFEADGTYDVWVVVTDTNNVEASNTVQVVVTPQPVPNNVPSGSQPQPIPNNVPTQGSDIPDNNLQLPFNLPVVTSPEPIADMLPLVVVASIVVIGGIALGKYSKNRNRGRRLRISPSAVVDIHTKGGTRE